MRVPNPPPPSSLKVRLYILRIIACIPKQNKTTCHCLIYIVHVTSKCYMLYLHLTFEAPEYLPQGDRKTFNTRYVTQCQKRQMVTSCTCQDFPVTVGLKQNHMPLVNLYGTCYILIYMFFIYMLHLHGTCSVSKST